MERVFAHATHSELGLPDIGCGNHLLDDELLQGAGSLFNRHFLLISWAHFLSP